MAHELSTRQPALAGLTLYAIIERLDTLQTWSTATPGWETDDPTHWPQYAVGSGVVSASGLWASDLPAGIAVRAPLRYTVFRQMAGSPAATDPVVGLGDGYWLGTAWGHPTDPGWQLRAVAAEAAGNLTQSADGTTTTIADAGDSATTRITATSTSTTRTVTLH